MYRTVPEEFLFLFFLSPKHPIRVSSVGRYAPRVHVSWYVVVIIIASIVAV